jgi:diguanylate cyclase (GGDEF)-like protein
MFDLDHFKSINDSYGHAVGDEALRLFAATVSTNMRDTDVIARFGGEEFVALLPGTIEDAVIAADRVRRAFESIGHKVGQHLLGATVSIGAASNRAAVNIEELIGAADAALYRAKLNGRNRVEQAGDEWEPHLPFVPMRAAA